MSGRIDDRFTECQADGMDASPLDWAGLGARIRSAAFAAAMFHRMQETGSTPKDSSNSNDSRDGAGE